MRIIGRILLGLVALIVVVAVAALAWRAWRQHENEAMLAIATPNGIVEASFVKIGGVEQWVQVRGENRNNPVLLIVSGGPGFSLIPVGYRFLKPWEKHFTVVNWDQRGAGLTYVRNGREAGIGLTIPRMVDDTIEVSDYVRKHLGKRKIVLLGWSWGSLLGIEAVHKRPDLYSAYIGTGQLVSGKENEAVGYAELLKRAQARHDAATVAKLKEIGPPPYDNNDELGTERRLLQPYTPKPEQDAFAQTATTMAYAPGYGLRDLYDVSAGATGFSIDKLWPSVMAYDARHLGGAFQVPFFVIDGEDDIQVPATVARTWFATITAPHKEFITIPNAAHLALATESEKFLASVNAKVRPLAVAGER